jgi:hypothetical protein
MIWPDSNVIIAAVGLIVAFVLGFDKFMSAGASIINKLRSERIPHWLCLRSALGAQL